MGIKFPTEGNKNSNKWELNFQPLEKILIGHVLEFVTLYWLLCTRIGCFVRLLCTGMG